MKRKKLLLVAAILSTAYVIYLISYFSGAVSSTSGMESLGAGLASAIVAPHMVCVGIGAVFNWLAWAMRLRWAALVAGILYAVSMVLMFLYALFVLLQMIFCFVSFATMKKKPSDPVPES